MGLSFKTKEHPSCPDDDTMNLYSFLINNHKYINLTFSILSKKRINSADIVKRIKVSPEIEDVLIDSKLDEYCLLMDIFYNTSKDCLSVRRGMLLELVLRDIKANNGTTGHQVIPESLVFYNGTELTKKDIDVVFKYLELELIECKATLENYLHVDPLPSDKKEKLEFMKLVKDKAESDSIECYLFLATYSVEVFQPKEILKNNKLDVFSILTRKDIIDRL